MTELGANSEEKLMLCQSMCTFKYEVNLDFFSYHKNPDKINANVSTEIFCASKSQCIQIFFVAQIPYLSLKAPKWRHYYSHKFRHGKF